MSSELVYFESELAFQFAFILPPPPPYLSFSHFFGRVEEGWHGTVNKQKEMEVKILEEARSVI